MSGRARTLQIACAAALLFAGPARAEGEPETLPVTGRIFSDVYVPTRDLGISPLRQASASLWLQGAPKLGEHGSANFILQADTLQAGQSLGGASSRTDVTVREGFAAYASGGWEFKAGRMILPWGKADAINPTDVLSAKDYTFLNPDEEVRRIGALSILTAWTPGAGSSPLTLTMIWTPVAPQSRMLFDSAKVTSSLPPGLTLSSNPVTPAATLARSELALKAAIAPSGWDASVFAFRGLSHMPELALFGSTIAPTYHRLTAAGGDFSFTAGSWIFRGEGDYAWTENGDGSNPLIAPTRVDLVAGVERPIGDDFRIQVQGLLRHAPRFTAPEDATGLDPASTALNSEIASANARILNYPERTRPGATVRFSYSNEASGLDAEVFLLGNFVGGDYLLRPKLSYGWTDAFETTIGVDHYAGPEDLPLGQLKAFNSLFIEAKYVF